MSGGAIAAVTARAAKAEMLRLADLPVTAWKNGGGTTVEYAVGPEGAGLDAFDWRVSRARVAAAGPFSVFPGIDRTLAVVEGGAIDLVFADRRERLDPTTPPLAFPADVAVDGRPTGGSIADLNVMTRRGRWSHRVDRLTVGDTAVLELGGDLAFIVAVGAVRVVLLGGVSFDLAPGDALRVEGRTDLRLEAGGPATAVLFVRLVRLPRP